jgi:hypothetical protein
MENIVDFYGSDAEFKAAQAWCNKILEGRWDARQSGSGEYEFAFARGDEAALFRDRHSPSVET